ncbi:PLP-dependent aminotransferase family protein [Micromonospora sp. LOL_021]|uniref:MocR-like pyridoxine biosynthesis transcription factor PdxR n=1 Tax=Micromonospora sp. LOL_021 TaxID=3345417 RepID=UPI003A89CFE0
MPEVLVELDRTRPGLAGQLTCALRAAISDGRLSAGTRLPSSRDLAGELALSRGVVVEAYEQLSAEGWLLARRGAGTTVAGRPPRTAGTLSGTAEPQSPSGGTERSPRADPVAVLRPGVPDLAMFPRADWRRAYERALRTARDADLDYGDPRGAPQLRAELTGYLGRVRAARIDPNHLFVTTGAAQAFGLLAGALRQRGATTVGIEDPGSPGVRGHLTANGLRLVPVPVDADGLDVAALAASGVAAVLVTPAHQFPTGVVLAPHRRHELLAWARRSGRLIIEDDYDAEFRYDRDPVGCLQGLAPDLVAHIGSVSKALAPGMRLGWLSVPPDLGPAVLAGKAAADLGGPVLEQLAFAELLGSGGYDRHLRRSRLVHRRRRDALIAALRRHLPQAQVSGIAAGLHLVLRLPAGVDDTALAAAATRAGLGPVPLSATRLDLSPAGRPSGGRTTAAEPGLVLGYAAHSPGELASAVQLLAGLMA